MFSCYDVGINFVVGVFVCIAVLFVVGMFVCVVVCGQSLHCCQYAGINLIVCVFGGLYDCFDVSTLARMPSCVFVCMHVCLPDFLCLEVCLYVHMHACVLIVVCNCMFA